MAHDNTSAPNQSVAALEEVTSTVYCSIKGDDVEAKKAIFNAISNSTPLKDEIGKTIFVKDVIAQNVRLEDLNQPGVFNDSVRVVLIDPEGHAYGTVSTGVMNSLTNLFAIMGKPDTWADPLEVSVNSVTGRRGFNFISLSLV